MTPTAFPLLHQQAPQECSMPGSSTEGGVIYHRRVRIIGMCYLLYYLPLSIFLSFCQPLSIFLAIYRPICCHLSICLYLSLYLLTYIYVCVNFYLVHPFFVDYKITMLNCICMCVCIYIYNFIIIDIAR